jgi:hypothetical protein
VIEANNLMVPPAPELASIAIVLGIRLLISALTISEESSNVRDTVANCSISMDREVAI